jgi:predicted DNA-binding transcriptional regulator AlpA
MNEPPNPRYVVRRAQAMRMLGVGSTTFDKLRKQPHFPRAVMLTERSPAWFADELESWLESRRLPKAEKQ